MSDVIDTKRAAASIAKMVDEFTGRCWNDEGRANFALIVERRLRRFRVKERAADSNDLSKAGGE